MRQAVFFLFLLSGSFYLQTAYGRNAAHPVVPIAPDARYLCDTLPQTTIGSRDSSARSTDSLSAAAPAILYLSDSVPLKPDSLPDPSALQKTGGARPSAFSAEPKKDSVRKKHDPRRATIYSAVLPGAGQVYNRKYWKLPLVYAAIGIPAYFFFYNKSWYKKCQYALAVTVNGSQGDSLARVEPVLRPFVTSRDVNGIITNRDTFRKNQDYSVLFFLLFYGLNIVDATVDAHLRDFNVNNDLSFKVKPLLIPGPSPIAGLTVVFDLHKGKPRPLNMN